jgi:hypothetical protein
MEVHMRYLRSSLAWVVVFSLAVFPVPTRPAAHSPVAILTSATHAHLNDAAAFPGLSVFEGERLSTESKGQMVLRAGRSVITLGGKSEIILIPLGERLHLDLGLGSLHFAGVENVAVEVHAEEAMIWPATSQVTQASIIIVTPKLLQITAERGNLNFSYHDEFQVLPEGQTFRIYLDSPAQPDDASLGGSQKSGIRTKVAYFIVGSSVAAVTAWGVHEAMKQNAPLSPAKP